MEYKCGRLHLALSLVLCAFLVGNARAGTVAFLDPNGDLAFVQDPGVTDAASALTALAAGPSQVSSSAGLVSAIPAGTTIQDLKIAGGTVWVDFSPEVTSGEFSEATLETIFRQVVWTLRQFDLGDDVKLSAGGVPLYEYLPPAPTIEPKAGIRVAPAFEAGVESLSGRSITLSPGHGKYWNGSGWYTARPVYCAPLNEEDYHNLENAVYLRTYLEQDGMLVKMSRADKNQGNSPYAGGDVWWHMAASYWLKNIGYPCSVYASYTGDCTLGTNASESSDDIRARPLASDYDGTDIYISLHTNGYQGDCTGSCPTGTDTYYDCSSEHAAWCTVSQNLSAAVHPALVNSIRYNVGDTGWVDRGQHDSNGAYGEIRIPDRAAILIELGFHDTCDNDALKLRDPWWVSGAMWGIYKGVCDYFGTAPTWGFYSSEYVSDTIPAQMAPGEYRQVQITLRDKGVVWNEAHAIRLGAVGDSDPFSAATRYTISGDVAPGSTYTFTVNLTAPTTPGNYVTDWQMVRDGVTWFGATVTRTIQVGGTPDTEPPTVPTDLQATAVSPTQVNLTWTASTDNVAVAGYRIYRDGGEIGTSATTSYSDSTCTSNTTYTYEVSAYDGALNESAKSAPAVVTTPIETDIVIDNVSATFTGSWATGTSSTDKYGPDYRYATTATSETATATFTPTIQAAGNYDVYCWYPQGTNRSAMAPYTVYWNGGSQTISVNQQAGGGQWNLLVTAKPFLPGTSGYVKIGNGTGEVSKVVMADAVRFLLVSQPDTEPPTVPTNLTATAVSSTSVELNWTASTDNVGVAGYDVRRDGVIIASSDTNTYTDNTVSPDTTYTYEVRAKDAVPNDSDWSTPANVTTPATTDVVTILTAKYTRRTSTLLVEATSSMQPTAVLTVSGFGQMTWNSKKSRYTYTLSPTSNPGTVTVTSSLGGSASKAVTVK
ncbi:MAG: GerMN domain-containing protein [Phycisphaerae bacterium]|nr:GerMN domain-containing protein [Phycisphaerae bacterium]